MKNVIPLPKELQDLLDSMKNGTHQWTEAEKQAYRAILSKLPADKAAQLASVIPPPGN